MLFNTKTLSLSVTAAMLSLCCPKRGKFNIMAICGPAELCCATHFVPPIYIHEGWFASECLFCVYRHTLLCRAELAHGINPSRRKHKPSSVQHGGYKCLLDHVQTESKKTTFRSDRFNTAVESSQNKERCLVSEPERKQTEGGLQRREEYAMVWQLSQYDSLQKRHKWKGAFVWDHVWVQPIQRQRALSPTCQYLASIEPPPTFIPWRWADLHCINI